MLLPLHAASLMPMWAAYGIKRPVHRFECLPSCPGAGRADHGGNRFARTVSLLVLANNRSESRQLECAVRAIGRAGSHPHLYLRGTPARGFVDRLRAIAAKSDVADRLHFLPPAAPSEMERLASVHDVGLSGEPGHTPNNKIALGNKLFTYLLAGVPLVMSDTPAHRIFIRELGAAAQLYRTDDADDLAATLDALLLDRGVLANARKAAFHLGQSRFNWDIEKIGMINCVASSLGSALPVCP